MGPAVLTLPSTLVKLVSPVYRILVMSLAETCGADVVHSANSLQQHGSCQIVHLGCVPSYEALVVLDTLGRLHGDHRAHCSGVVVVQANHIDDGTQDPLRSRSHPAGPPALCNQLPQGGHSKSGSSDRCVDCRTSTHLFGPESRGDVFCPEDFGGHERDGPTSPWAQQNLRQLGSFTDVKRTVFHVCSFAGTTQRRPLAVLTNTTIFEAFGYQGCPALRTLDDHNVYDGPVPKTCPWLTKYLESTGLASDHTFNTSLSTTLTDLPSLGMESSSSGQVLKTARKFNSYPVGHLCHQTQTRGLHFMNSGRTSTLQDKCQESSLRRPESTLILQIQRTLAPISQQGHRGRSISLTSVRAVPRHIWKFLVHLWGRSLPVITSPWRIGRVVGWVDPCVVSWFLRPRAFRRSFHLPCISYRRYYLLRVRRTSQGYLRGRRVP